MRQRIQVGLAAYISAAILIGLSGCSSFDGYFKNGFKVGPNYCPAEANVAEHWIDAADPRVRKDSADLSRWWTVFNDPVLSGLIVNSFQQNLTVKEAGCRILGARAKLGIARGDIFPQSQTMTGSGTRTKTSAAVAAVGGGGGQKLFVLDASGNPINPPIPVGPDPAAIGTQSLYSSNLNYGFNLAWELDFWGKFRRAVTAADANLQASVEDYDAAIVTLLGDVATNYVNVRQYQEQIELSKANVELQRGVLKIVQARLDAGRTSELDVDQAQAQLSQTEASIPLLEVKLRQAENQLCILMGMPPVDLQARLGVRPIPTAPPEVAVGIPAELLSRRPDVRKAERNAAAQAEEIGIAQADFYPHISITGNMGYSAAEFSDLFRSGAFNGSVGPSFQWNILNYGRIANNVRFQDATFQEKLLIYRQTVLQANADVENGIIAFLRSQQQAKMLADSVVANEKAVNIVVNQYRVGTVDFNRVATLEQNLVTAQDAQAQARALIAQGLIQVYRALGGGWQIRLEEGDQPTLTQPPHAAPAPEKVPMPAIQALDAAGKEGPIALPEPPKPPVAVPDPAAGQPSPIALPETPKPPIAAPDAAAKEGPIAPPEVPKPPMADKAN